MAKRPRTLPNQELIMIPPVRSVMPRCTGNYQDLVPPCVPEFVAATSLTSPRRFTSGFVQLLDAMGLLVIIGSYGKNGTTARMPLSRMLNFDQRCNEFPRNATGRSLSRAEPQCFVPWSGERADEHRSAAFHPGVEIIPGLPQFSGADGKYHGMADSFAPKQPTESNCTRQAFGVEGKAARRPFHLVR
jgi:hypothetical protein